MVLKPMQAVDWTNMKTFEITFSIINEDGSRSSDSSFITTRIQAFDSFKAEAIIRGQYRNCEIHGCYQID